MLKTTEHDKSITAYYWLIHESYTILYKMSRQLIKLKTRQNMIEDTPNSNFSSQPKYEHVSTARDRKVKEGSATTSLSWRCRCRLIRGCCCGCQHIQGGCYCRLILSGLHRLWREIEVAHGLKKHGMTMR